MITLEQVKQAIEEGIDRAHDMDATHQDYADSAAKLVMELIGADAATDYSDPPRDIWAVQHEAIGAIRIGEWADSIRHLGGEHYIRADIYAAEVARMTAEREALIAATLERAADHLQALANKLWPDGNRTELADTIRALATQPQADALAAVRREARAEVWAEAMRIIDGIERPNLADTEGALPPDYFDEGTNAAYDAILAAAQKEAGQ